MRAFYWPWEDIFDEDDCDNDWPMYGIELVRPRYRKVIFTRLGLPIDNNTAYGYNKTID